jgi:hypothetical protein
MKQQRENPLKGLSVPSVEEIAEEIIGHFGIATIDLADQKQRQRFHQYLSHELRSVIRRRLVRAIERACSKAVKHVIQLMDDTRYQELRALRAEAAKERAKERAEKRSRETQAEREARRQARRGLVQ